MQRTVLLREAADMLQTYPRCTPEAAQRLVKAARLYQQAVWGAEADPQSAWLQLISAIEAAAIYWFVGDASPFEHVANTKPEWAEKLRQLPEDDANWLAQQLAPLITSTSRFLRFALEHLPDPPEERPPEALQLDWAAMKKHLKKIYEHRSRTLHDGTPIPLPMLHAPFQYERGAVASEKPLGLGTYGAGGTWTAEDTPMLLATFEYIARGVLVNWWRSLAV